MFAIINVILEFDKNKKTCTQTKCRFECMCYLFFTFCNKIKESRCFLSVYRLVLQMFYGNTIDEKWVWEKLKEKNCINCSYNVVLQRVEAIDAKMV